MIENTIIESTLLNENDNKSIEILQTYSNEKIFEEYIIKLISFMDSIVVIIIQRNQYYLFYSYLKLNKLNKLLKENKSGKDLKENKSGKDLIDYILNTIKEIKIEHNKNHLLLVLKTEIELILNKKLKLSKEELNEKIIISEKKIKN